jgi:signal peptide peptidase SppA
MIRGLPHIMARVFNVPLLIAPARAEALVSGLSAALLNRGSALPPALFSDEPQRPDPKRPRGYRVERGVALLPVRGVLVRRAGQVDADSTPLQSYEGLRRSLRDARRDNDVRGILLELDTPGGEAGGVFEVARDIRATTQEKPVWAVANDDALSAGYAIASAAQRIWITETGAAGSVGVVALHLDQSGFDEKTGLRFTYVYRGARKIDGNPHSELSADAIESVQAEVDRLYELFVASAAAHRGVPPERLRATEAAIYCGENAVREGLADQRGTYEQAQAAMAETIGASPRRTGARSFKGARPMEEENPAESGANVVSLDEVRASIAAEIRRDAGEIAALCALAGYPEQSAEHIRSGASLEQVRESLQAHKANVDARRQTEAIDTSAAKPNADMAALHAAAAARFAAAGTPQRHA